MAASPKFPRAPIDGASEPLSEAEGFAISLPSAQLGDLIQINCLNRIRGAFRVSSGAHEGYLFFELGQLIHADCGAATGLDAVVQMLGWRGGSIQPCLRPWPAESTIDMGADALLLSAAQRIDEAPARDGSREDATTKVVRRVAWPAEPAHAPPARSAGDQLAAGAAERPSLGATLVGGHLSQLQIAQVSLDGTILQLKSGAAPDLADTAFFCQRMATMIGESLGVGDCRALSLDGARESIVVFRGRSLVATRGKTSDLGFILRRVGLT